jgi:hypothetical protein
MPEVHRPWTGDRFDEQGNPVLSISQAGWEKPASAAAPPTPGGQQPAAQPGDPEAALAAAQARWQQLQAQPIEPLKQFDEPRPRRQDFDDPYAYDDARDDWADRRNAAGMERRLAERERERPAAEIAAAEQQYVGALASGYAARRAAFVEAYPDYAEVAESDALRITDVMAALIARHPAGPAVAYHLGKNLNEATRLAQLDPASQAAEFGRLTALLGSEPTAARSASPAPAQPRDATGKYVRSANVATAREEPMEQYGARRTAELMAARTAAGRR